MGKVGERMNDVERRSKSLLHLLQYSITMGVRRDRGGMSEEAAIEVVAGAIRGNTARKAAELFIDRLDEAIDGVRVRQKPTVDDFRRRFKGIQEVMESVEVPRTPSVEERLEGSVGRGNVVLTARQWRGLWGFVFGCDKVSDSDILR